VALVVRADRGGRDRETATGRGGHERPGRAPGASLLTNVAILGLSVAVTTGAPRSEHEGVSAATSGLRPLSSCCCSTRPRAVQRRACCWWGRGHTGS
jgi:hypothetical protein